MPVAGRNAARRLLGGEPCAGESHARFGEGGLETEPPRPPRQPSTLHPRSSPPAYGEIRASKRGVEPSLRKVQLTSPQHEAKSAASLVDARKGATGSRA